MVDLYGLAEKINIDDIAVCHAGPFDEVEAILKRDMELGILPPFTEENIQKRVNPEETMAGAASFIVILEHYKPEVYKRRKGFYGNISPAACGEDYHRIVRSKLNLLLQALKEDDSEGQYLAYVDNSPFSEKHIAVRAGMGQIMRNGLFYSREYGSRCFIGLILADKKPEYYGLSMRHDGDEEWFSRCKSCKACQNLCPGEAITDKGFNSYRCVSYLTQKKEALTKDEERKLGLQIYGCDICQKVCPLNPACGVEYETGREVDLTELMEMSNKQFNQIYRQTAAGWRGKKILQRNAEAVRKNILER